MIHPTVSAVQSFEGDLSLLSAGFSDRLAALPEREKESILKALHQLAVMIGDPAMPSSPNKTMEESTYSGIPLDELVNRQINDTIERGTK
jgi:hypothetical protein